MLKRSFIQATIALSLSWLTLANAWSYNPSVHAQHSAAAGLFKMSWVYRTQQAQTYLGSFAPLAQTNFLATHNSFNSSYYQSPVRYLDPNQELSVYHQLQFGIRALEMDLHSFASTAGWPWEWQRTIILCHTKFGDLGCSTFDHKFIDGLKEVKRWLDETQKNPELLLIYLEDKLNPGDHAKAIRIIEETIGPEVYRPNQAFASNGCTPLPLPMSKRDILSSGKRVLLVTDQCTDAGFSTWVHGYGLPTDNARTFVDQKNCQSAEYTQAQYDSLLIRFIEDRTELNDIFGTESPYLTPELSAHLQRCGANILAWDMLKPNDARLESTLWSWDRNEPGQYLAYHCAKQAANTRFQSSDCNNLFAFACKSADGLKWQVTTQIGRWSEGFEQCQSAFGPDYSFAVPHSAQSNERLRVAKAAARVHNVWLNYADQSQTGKWQIGSATK